MKKLKNNNWYIFAKPSDRLDIIRNAHIVTSHSAQTKTLEKIIEDYLWERLSFDVAKYINNCALCQKDKPFNNSTTFNLNKPNFAFHTVSMILIRPLPTVLLALCILL